MPIDEILTTMERIVEKQNQKIGKQLIQKAVLQWAIRWKMYMPAQMIDDLINTIEKEVNNESN